MVFEKQGFQAVATTSAGIAYALGYPDGEDITIDDLCLVVSQICKRVSIPVSVDFERGYGDTPEEVKKNARKLINAGAVGFNIEDGLANGSLENLEKQLQKIAALFELKLELGLEFVINARTCAYWLNVADEDMKLQIAIERCNAFAKAGADCIFVPGALSEHTVAALVNDIDAPLNLIANPVFNDFKKMNKMGVRRISIGSGAVRSVFNHLIGIGADLQNGTMEQMTNHTFSYAEANAFFTT